MRHLVFLSLPALVACAKPTAPADAPAEAATEEAATEEAAPAVQHFGEAFTVEDVTAAATLLTTPADYVDKNIRVEGRVTDVCQKAGCWLVLAEGDKSIRVLTKAHKFFVAKDSTGQTCRIEGVVNAKDIDPETVAHFESESANKDVIPEKSVEGTKTFELVASGIQIQRVAAD